MAEDILITYEQLDLQMGQIVQISPRDGSNAPVFYDAMIVGAIPGECIIFSGTETSVIPVVTEGGHVVMRVVLADGVAMFSSIALIVADDPLPMIYLDFPKRIKFKQVRKAKRIPVLLPFLASNVTTESNDVIDGNIIDISASGAGLSVDEHLGNVGEEITIKFTFRVEGRSRYLNMSAIICSRRKQTAEKAIYGVEFQEDKGDDILVLFGFVFYSTSFGTMRAPVLPIDIKSPNR